MRGTNWEAWYRALKELDPDAYKNAIQSMEAVTLTFNVPTKAAAEYERAAVMLACQLLGVRPPVPLPSQDGAPIDVVLAP